MASKSDKTLLLDTSQPETRKQVFEAIRALEGLYTTDLTRKRWRVGNGQRGYYWGYMVTEVSKLIDKYREQTDKALNAMFLSEPWEIAGQTITVVRSLSDLAPGAKPALGLSGAINSNVIINP